MHDARGLLTGEAAAAAQEGTLYDLLYADDTLLLSSSATGLQEFASTVERAGAAYGMSLHWGKTQMMSIGTETPVLRPDGSPFDKKANMQYLGGQVSCDGRPDSEISRKVGLATADFKKMQRFWGHAGVGRTKKIQAFTAIVVSKLCTASVVFGLSLRRREG